jgi:hypothetical protein
MKNQYLTSLRKENTKTENEIATLKAKLHDFAKKENLIHLDNQTHNDFLQIMKNHHHEISNSNNNFQKLFWESRINAVNKTKTSVR